MQTFPLQYHRDSVFPEANRTNQKLLHQTHSHLFSKIPIQSPQPATLPLMASDNSSLVGSGLNTARSSGSFNATSSKKYRCGPWPTGGLGGMYTDDRRFFPYLNPLLRIFLVSSSCTTSNSRGLTAVVVAGIE